jgi:hypothetical protein
MAGLIGKLTLGVSAGIGLAGEKYYDHKERKAASSEQEHVEPSRNAEEYGHVKIPKVDETSTKDDKTADDEQIWALDEAAGSQPAYDSIDSNPDQIIAELAHTVAEAKNHQVHIHNGEISRLANPVIIPQRRPGSTARGWTRAYAPDLEPLGIDKDTFMKFLESWDRSAHGSPWFKAVTLTAGIVGMALPGPIIRGVMTAVTIAAE